VRIDADVWMTTPEIADLPGVVIRTGEYGSAAAGVASLYPMTG